MHLEKFDLNLLVAIDAILRRRSVTAAAEDLHITQSALSSALKRARQHFEDDLFYYDGHSMTPTAFGESLQDRIPGLISELRALTRLRATSDLRDLSRDFTIIASDYVSAVYVSALTKHLIEIAPQVSLTVVPYTREAIRQFERGVLDFLIGPRFALKAGYTAEPLFEDSFECVLCAQNPVLKTGLSEEAFFASSMVVTNFFLEDGKSHFERWLESQARGLRVVASVPSFVVLPHFISGTQNIATIHKRLVPHFAAFSGLSFVKPPVDIPPLREYLVTTDRHKHDSDAQLLAEAMKEVSLTI